MGELAFLWQEAGAWNARVARGSMGRGATRESALARLREALHAEHRARPGGDSERDRLGSGPNGRATEEEFDRQRLQELDTLGVDRCLLVSPVAFETMLAAQCRRADPSPSGFDLSRRPFIRLCGDPSGASYFRRHRILSIESGRYELEARSTWFPIWLGSFAFDGSRLHFLNRRTENLRAVIEAEQRPLDEADAETLARFFAEVAGRRGCMDHTLVTLESIERMEQKGEYTVDLRELGRIAPALEPASIVAHDSGWTLRFATLYGWSGEKNEVFDWRIEVSHRFALDIRTRVLSPRIFHTTPIVME